MIKTAIKHFIIDNALKYLFDTYTTEFSAKKCIYLYGNEINKSHVGMRLCSVDLRYAYPIPITYINKLRSIPDIRDYTVIEFDDSYRPPGVNKNVYLVNSALHKHNPKRRIGLRSDTIYGLTKEKI